MTDARMVKRYHVAELGSDRLRYFTRLDSAARFAGEQAASSFCTPEWMITEVVTDLDTLRREMTIRYMVNAMGQYRTLRDATTRTA